MSAAKAATFRYAHHKRRRRATTDLRWLKDKLSRSILERSAQHGQPLDPFQVDTYLDKMLAERLLTVKLSPASALLWRAGYAPLQARLIYQTEQAARVNEIDVVLVDGTTGETLYTARGVL